MTVTTKRSIIALLLSLVLVVSLFTVNIAAADAETEVVTESESERIVREETTNTLIINSAIIAGIIVIIAIVAIKFRKKLGAFLRSVKSELKKIVWTSKENTRKGFLVVAIVAVAFAVAIGLIDFAFQTGISSLAEIFN